MKDQYSIKPLTSDDANLIKELFADVFTNEPWNDDWSDEDQLRKYLADIIGNPNSLSLGLFDNDELYGIALGSVMHWYTGTEYYIREFCIRRTAQHQGLGSLFLSKAEDYLRQINIYSIILTTEADTPAHDFYAKNDFEELTESRFFQKKLR